MTLEEYFTADLFINGDIAGVFHQLISHFNGWLDPDGDHTFLFRGPAFAPSQKIDDLLHGFSV